MLEPHSGVFVRHSIAFVAAVLSENKPMLAVFHNSGYNVGTVFDKDGSALTRWAQHSRVLRAMGRKHSPREEAHPWGQPAPLTGPIQESLR